MEEVKPAKKRKTWYATPANEQELAEVMSENGIEDESAMIRLLVHVAAENGLTIGKQKRVVQPANKKSNRR